MLVIVGSVIVVVCIIGGYAPAVSVEFARKTLFAHERPSFYEVEEAVAELPAT